MSQKPDKLDHPTERIVCRMINYGGKRIDVLPPIGMAEKRYGHK